MLYIYLYIIHYYLCMEIQAGHGLYGRLRQKTGFKIGVFLLKIGFATNFINKKNNITLYLLIIF